MSGKMVSPVELLENLESAVREVLVCANEIEVPFLQNLHVGGVEESATHLMGSQALVLIDHAIAGLEYHRSHLVPNSVDVSLHYPVGRREESEDAE